MKARDIKRARKLSTPDNLTAQKNLTIFHNRNLENSVLTGQQNAKS